MAAKMLRLCGIGAMDPVILCAYGNTNKFVPARAKGQKNYDWEAVTKQAKKGVRQWEKVEANLTDDTPNLGFISCPGGTRVKCKQGRDDIQEITEGRVLFFEVDKGLTKEEQIAAPATAGLPPATFQLDTGGKSVWSYYVLDTTYPLDDVIHGRRALSEAIEQAHPGVVTDHALWSPHQPTRRPVASSQNGEAQLSSSPARSTGWMKSSVAARILSNCRRAKGVGAFGVPMILAMTSPRFCIRPQRSCRLQSH